MRLPKKAEMEAKRGKKMENETERKEEKPAIKNLTKGSFLIEGIFRNEKSVFQPSYILFGVNDMTYSAGGTVARQIEENFDKLKDITFQLDIEEGFSEKFKKPYLYIESVTKVADKATTRKINFKGF